MGPWWGSQGPRRGPRKPLQAAKIRKNVTKILPKRRCRRALYAKFPWPAGLRGSGGVCARVRARGRHHSAESREPSRSTRAARARAEAEADRNGPGKRHVPCVHVRRAAARPPVHLTRSAHTPAAVAPFPCRTRSWGQEAGRGFWLPLATADDDTQKQKQKPTAG